MAQNKKPSRKPKPPVSDPAQSQARWLLPLLPLGAGGFFWWGIEQVFPHAPPIYGLLAIWVGCVLTLITFAYLLSMGRMSFVGWLFGLMGIAVGASILPIVNLRLPEIDAAQGAITAKLASPFFLHDPGIDLQNTTNRKVIYEVEELTYAINGEIKATIIYDKPNIILAGSMTTVSPPKAIDISAYPEGKTVGIYLFLALRYGFENEGPTRYLSVQRLCDVPQIPNQPVDCRFRKRDNDFLVGD